MKRFLTAIALALLGWRLAPFRMVRHARMGGLQKFTSLDIDIEHCSNCGGALKIIAAIEEPPVIARILAHLGLPTRASPRSPARRVEWLASGHFFQAA